MSTTRWFTAAHIKAILKIWPQAVSADGIDGSDLRVLHDLADAGAQGWGESLRWPDYLWVGIESLPEGRSRLSGGIDCIVELKVITKLRESNDARDPDRVVRRALGGPIRDADEQIRDFHRILGFPDVRGVAIIVNEASPFPLERVHRFLSRALRDLQHTDALVYLSNGRDRRQVSTVLKDGDDDTVRRFKEDFLTMLHAVDWSKGRPIVRGGPYPRFGIRIEMDERSYLMYRTRSTGWRVSNDPAPIPTPNPRLQIVPLDAYSSGLARR